MSELQRSVLLRRFYLTGLQEVASSRREMVIRVGRTLRRIKMQSLRTFDSFQVMCSSMQNTNISSGGFIRFAFSFSFFH